MNMSDATTTPRITEERVREALQRVTDFDRGADVVSLGMVSDIAIGEDGVYVTLQVDPKDAPGKEPLRAACERTIKTVLGIDRVTAVLTAHRGNGDGAAAMAGGGGGAAEGLVERIVDGLHPGVRAPRFDGRMNCTAWLKPTGPSSITEPRNCLALKLEPTI